jgi:hypothetical protein
MQPVARRLIAAGLCAALQIGAWCAPLVHAHLDDHHDDHHDAAAIHAHVGGHPQGPAKAGHHVHTDVASGFSLTKDEPAVGASDGPEQTTRLQIFVAVAAAAFVTPALPPARFTLPPALESGTRRPPELVRSHGPPDLGRTGSRAPPALSVLI